MQIALFRFIVIRTSPETVMRAKPTWSFWWKCRRVGSSAYTESPWFETYVVVEIHSTEATVATVESFYRKKKNAARKPIVQLVMKEHFFFLPFHFSKRPPRVVHFDNDWLFSLCSSTSANVPLHLCHILLFIANDLVYLARHLVWLLRGQLKNNIRSFDGNFVRTVKRSKWRSERTVHDFRFSNRDKKYSGESRWASVLRYSYFDEFSVNNWKRSVKNFYFIIFQKLNYAFLWISRSSLVQQRLMTGESR